MDLHKTSEEVIKYRSLKLAMDQRHREKKQEDDKYDNNKKELIKKQTFDSQFQALIFSIQNFRKQQFFKKLRLTKLKNLLFAARNRKRKLRMIQQLNAINDAMEKFNNQQKQQQALEEQSHKSRNKSITLFRDLLKKRLIKPLQSRPLRENGGPGKILKRAGFPPSRE